jgi:hypothetical protein
MEPKMDTRGDVLTNHDGRTTVSRRRVMHGLGALTLALLSLGGRLRSVAAEEGTGTYLRLKVEPQDAVRQPSVGFPAWTSPSATQTP